MITDYLFLGPDREFLCTLDEIRRYVEKHYCDRRVCPNCGCYLIPTGQTHRSLFRMYRCANSICSGALRLSRLWPCHSWRVADILRGARKITFRGGN